jgi:hypothetical protein
MTPQERRRDVNPMIQKNSYNRGNSNKAGPGPVTVETYFEAPLLLVRFCPETRDEAGNIIEKPQLYLPRYDAENDCMICEPIESGAAKMLCAESFSRIYARVHEARAKGGGRLTLEA